MKRVNSVHAQKSALIETQQLADSLFLPDPSPIHHFYGDYFNLVDLADIYWYKVQESHKNHSWRSKLLLGNMKFAMLNAWVMAGQVKYEEWLTFRAHLAAEVKEYNI